MKFKQKPLPQYREPELDSSCPLNYFEKSSDGSLVVSNKAPIDISHPEDYDIETLVANQVDVSKKVNFSTDADIDSVSAIEDNLGTQLAKQLKSSSNK